MTMKKLTRLKQLNRNHFFLIGFTVGLVLTICMPDHAWEITAQECPELEVKRLESTIDDFEPRLNLINKPMIAKKIVKNIIRPRYYSSELGIREKLFVGVMTSQDRINTAATAFNRTTAHLVDKIKYFINAADNVRTNFQLKNIVGFTDARDHLKPFHVMKYIADNYLDDYDFFLLTTDTTYVNVRQLLDRIRHISITFDVYIGETRSASEMMDSAERNRIVDIDRSYCDLESGILLSSGLIRKIRSNLDWCVRNAATNFDSLNIGRCVKYSSKIGNCQQSFQGIDFRPFKLNTYKLYRDLHFLHNDPSFNNATILHPIQSPEDFYILHSYFSRHHLEENHSAIRALERKAHQISNGTYPKDFLELHWPLGVPPTSVPVTRHDLLVWTMLNETHQIVPNSDDGMQKLSDVDSDDIRKVIDRTLAEGHRKYPKLNYKRLHSAYRRFDPIRGMDYQLHMIFEDAENQNAEVLKRFEAVKPIGKVEVLSSPYVTESTRIAMLMPTFEHQINEAHEFILNYEKICMERQDNTFLMLVFLYQANSPSKTPDDVFYNLKMLALNLSEKYKNDGSRIAWLSIRLPEKFIETHPRESAAAISSVYGRQEVLGLVMTDLALRKIGLDSLVMVVSNEMSLRQDFLNRVRMNTVQGFQVFSPIGFSMYPCSYTNLCKECDTCDVSQSAGHFNIENNDVISFYSRDYVEARKNLEQSIPIIRSDNDIENIITRADQSIVGIVDLFIKADTGIHVMRAVEPNLRFGAAIRNHLNRTKYIPQCEYWNTSQVDKCTRIASRKQIGDALVKYQENDFSQNERRVNKLSYFFPLIKTKQKDDK